MYFLHSLSALTKCLYSLTPDARTYIKMFRGIAFGANTRGAYVFAPGRTQEKTPGELFILRAVKAGGGNPRRGENIPQNLPQERFWTPPPMIRFPPRLCSRPVIFPRENWQRPDESSFLRPPKMVLEGALYSTFPPQKIARYVLLLDLQRVCNLRDF